MEVRSVYTISATEEGGSRLIAPAGREMSQGLAVLALATVKAIEKRLLLHSDVPFGPYLPWAENASKPQAGSLPIST